MKASLLWLLSFAAPALGQTLVKGTVVDERGDGIPGANISIAGSYDGTSTVVDGSFSFETSERGGHTVVVTFVGYKSREEQVDLEGKDVVLSITLKEEINQLDAVTITAGSFTAGEEKRRTILKPVDIATTAGATADIAGAINTLPGTQKVGETGRLFVRGGESSEARTFIDGMVVLDAYGPSAPNTPSRGRFLPFMFKGTSFSTGGYSAEYGQALSSALVLNSKDIATFSQTDIGILSVGADLAHTQAWERSSLSGKIQYTNVRPYFGWVDQRVDWETPPASIQASTAYRTQVGKDGILKFFGNVNHTDFAQYNHSIAQPALRQLQELSNDYGYGNATYRQSLNGKWSVRGGLSYNYNENDQVTAGIPAGEVERGVHSKVVFENTLSDKVELRAGGEAMVRDYTAWKSDVTSGETLRQGFRESITASFAEAEAYANKHFVAKAGARLEHNSLTTRLSVDPRISLAYRPGATGQFSFAYGLFRQSVTNQYLRANPALLPERAEHFILNYQIVASDRTFRVETYYKRYEGLVKINPDNSLNNNGSGYARGVELFWRDNRSLRNVDYWVSYSFLDTERDYLDFPVQAVPSFASRHNFSFVYKHFVTKIKSQLGFTWSYASPRPYYNPNNEKFHSDTTPSYQDLSANVAYLPRNWLIIYFSCTNILGRDNIFGYNYASVPGADGVYAGEPIRQAAPRFVFVGVFITISPNKSVNQLPNL